MFIREVLSLAGTRCPICFSRVCEHPLQVLIPITSPNRSEKFMVMQGSSSFCYLKVGQCLMFKKMVPRYTPELHTTQPCVQRSWKNWQTNMFTMTWCPKFPLFAQLSSINNTESAAKWSRAMAVSCWGWSSGNGISKT